MSSENPGTFQNIPDVELQDGKATYDTQQSKAVGNQRLNYELLADGSAYAGESRQVYPHTHGDLNGSSLDGLTKRRTLFSKSFQSGTNTTASWTFASTWTEMLRIRVAVGPFKRVCCEVRYKVDANGVKFRHSMWDWNDSAAASDGGGGNGTQYIEESSYNTSTSLANHTIDGTSYSDNGAGGYTNNGSTKMQTVNVTSYTDLDEACNLHEFVLEGYGSASMTVELASIHVFELKTTDEGAGGIVS